VNDAHGSGTAALEKIAILAYSVSIAIDCSADLFKSAVCPKAEGLFRYGTTRNGMAPLIRPTKSNKSRLMQQVGVEITMEQQLLTSMGELKGQVRDLRMSLMGDGDDGETPYGRLPIAESKMKEHAEYMKALDVRLRVLEDAHTRYGVYGRFITGGSAAAAGIIGVAVERFFHYVFGK
jgi:hypothetical protein